jgi:hypothetical protein
MKFGEKLRSVEITDRQRQFLSLAGGFLISLAGFALIFVLFGYLQSRVLIWYLNFPHLGRTIRMVLPVEYFCMAIIPSLIAMKRQRSKRKDPIHKL